jgi:arsenate reductase (glutaredoxin)
MPIQIFGTNKCFNTKKAERFFKERRVPYHLRDLTVKSLSKGEILNISRSVPTNNLLNRDSSIFLEKGLHVTSLHPEKIISLLQDHPLLTSTPIVRYGNNATLGYKPEVWNTWVKEIQQENTK